MSKARFRIVSLSGHCWKAHQITKNPDISCGCPECIGREGNAIGRVRGAAEVHYGGELVPAGQVLEVYRERGLL